MGKIVSDKDFIVEQCLPGKTKNVLLINPPVYDAQYWARWSQPAGLLRIAALLKHKGYKTRLIDCMETNASGMVPKRWRYSEGQRVVVRRDDIVKPLYHFGLSLDELAHRMQLGTPPDEVWITSIMTYWWESTRDVVNLARQLFPQARILVGGIYPTLAAEHAQTHLDADIIFKGELSEASQLPSDLTLYQTPPSYAILATSRGCPWDCVYCAARTLNGGTKVRTRSAQEVVAEIKDKYTTLKIRHFGFYEDNALINREHFIDVMEALIASKLPLELYAPEGFETRLLDVDLLKLMKQAGFRKVHLPLETVRSDVNRQWNRRHSNTTSFEAALEAAIQAGFRPRTQDINAFVLFGLPDERIEDVVASTLYAHHLVGSVVPMLFSPVPGTRVFKDYKDYLLTEMGWGLEDLNGKFLPFLEYNQRRYPQLHASDYLELEGLMSILNKGRVLSRAVDLCDDSLTSQMFRSTIRDLVHLSR